MVASFVFLSSRHKLTIHYNQEYGSYHFQRRFPFYDVESFLKLQGDSLRAQTGENYENVDTSCNISLVSGCY